jgi:hypothetical protein
MYSRMSLWALSFLRDPPICVIGCLGGPASCEVVVVGVVYVVVSPLPCSSYTEKLSFFPICPSFFGALPFFYCTVFGPGFVCCIGFLVVTLPLADVLDDPASTSFPLGMSLVMTRIFQSSCKSFIAHSTSSMLIQNQSCSHSLSRSLRAWIHILCCVALKLAIPWYCATTSRSILQVLAIFSCIPLRYREKVLALPLLQFESEVLPNNVYHVV